MANHKKIFHDASGHGMDGSIAGHYMSAKPNAKAPLGQGGRFAALKQKLAKKGVSNPAGLAAYIGRKKYGAKKFAQLSAKGRKA